MRKRERIVASGGVSVDRERFEPNFSGNPATLQGLSVRWSAAVYRSHRDGVVIDGLLRNPEWKVGAGCGRSLVLKVGNLKRIDLNIAKFSKETREVGIPMIVVWKKSRIGKGR